MLRCLRRLLHHRGYCTGPDELVAVDVETTNRSVAFGKVIEIGCVRMSRSGSELGRWQSLVYAETVPKITTEITGITSAMAKSAPSLDIVIQQFSDFIGSRPIVCHNATFDRRFLEAAALQTSRIAPANKFYCTLQLSRRLFSDLSSHKLGDIAQALPLPIPSGSTFHRALHDAQVTATLWARLHSRLADILQVSDVPLSIFDHLSDMTAGQAVQWIETGCDITKKGKVIVKKSAVSMSAEKTEKPEKTEKTEKMEKFPEPDKYDTALFEQLRSLRAEIARRRNIKPYVVLTDVALRSLAGYKPDTEFALYHLKGFGDVTVERYGKAVLAVVAGMPFAEAVGLVAFDSDLGTN